MQNQNGFTLIEMIVVIVVLGILSAVALPKFIDVQVDARRASIDGLQGAVQSANALAHAQALIDGATAATGSITMEGTAVALVYGYPSLAGIAAAVSTDGFTYAAGTGIFTITGYTGANCTVTYAQATSAGTPAVTTASTVIKDNTGCL